jgi:hypothetical protein
MAAIHLLIALLWSLATGLKLSASGDNDCPSVGETLHALSDAGGVWTLTLVGLSSPGGVVDKARDALLSPPTRWLEEPERLAGDLITPLLSMWSEVEFTFVDGAGLPLPHGRVETFSARTPEEALAQARSSDGYMGILGQGLGWLLDPLNLFSATSSAYERYAAPLNPWASQAHASLSPFTAEHSLAVKVSAAASSAGARGGGTVSVRCRRNPVAMKRPLLLLLGLALGAYAEDLASSHTFLLAGGLSAALALSCVLVVYFIWRHQDKRSTLAASFLAAFAAYSSITYKAALRAAAHPALYPLLDNWEYLLGGCVLLLACAILYFFAGLAAGNPLSHLLLTRLIQGLGLCALYASCAWPLGGAGVVGAILFSSLGYTAVGEAVRVGNNVLGALLRVALWVVCLPEVVVEGALWGALGGLCCAPCYRRPFRTLMWGRWAAGGLGYVVTLGDVRAYRGPEGVPSPSRQAAAGGGGGGAAAGAPAGVGASPRGYNDPQVESPGFRGGEGSGGGGGDFFLPGGGGASGVGGLQQQSQQSQQHHLHHHQQYSAQQQAPFLPYAAYPNFGPPGGFASYGPPPHQLGRGGGGGGGAGLSGEWGGGWGWLGGEGEEEERGPRGAGGGGGGGGLGGSKVFQRRRAGSVGAADAHAGSSSCSSSGGGGSSGGSSSGAYLRGPSAPPAAVWGGGLAQPQAQAHPQPAAAAAAAAAGHSSQHHHPQQPRQRRGSMGNNAKVQRLLAELHTAMQEDSSGGGGREEEE